MTLNRVTLFSLLIGLASPLCIDLYLAVIPAISSEFKSPGEHSLSILFIAIAIGQLTFGYVYDLIGAQRNAIVCLLGFILVSISIAFSQSYEALLVGRFIQGFFTGGLAVTALSIIKDNNDSKNTGAKIGVLNGIMNIIPTIAPTIGLIILSISGNWRPIFIALALFGLGCLLIASGRISLKHSQIEYLNYSSLLSNTTYIRFGVIAILSLAILLLYVTLAPSYFINKLHFSEFQFAVAFALNGLLMMASAWIHSILSNKFNSHELLSIGGALSLLAFLFSLISLMNFWFLPVSFSLFSISFIFIIASSTELSLSKIKAGTGFAVALISALQMGLGGFFGAITTALKISANYAFSMVLALILLAIFERSYDYFCKKPARAPALE